MKSKEEKITMAEERENIIAILRSGYAALDGKGNIVDRRKEKPKQVFAENKLLGIPEPKK